MFSEGTVHSRTTGIPSTRYRSPAHQKRYIYSNGIFSFLFFSSLLFSLSPFFFEETLLGFSKKLRSSRDPCLRFSRGFVNTFRSQFFRTNSSVRNAIFKHDFKILYIYILRIGFFTFFFLRREKDNAKNIPIVSDFIVFEKDRYAYHRGDFCISL